MPSYLADPEELVFHGQDVNLLLWEDRVGSGTVSLTYTFIQTTYGWPSFYGQTQGPEPLTQNWTFVGAVPTDPQNPYELQQTIEDILAPTSSARSDFRVSFADIADIEFSSEAQQGNGIDDVGDTADYSGVKAGAINAYVSDAGGTVAKGVSGSLGTDSLYSIAKIVGTSLDDTLRGAGGWANTSVLNPLEYDGKNGYDTYTIDLATDRGTVYYTESGASGVDILQIKNVTSDILIG